MIDESMFEMAKRFNDPTLMRVYSDHCRDNGNEKEADFFLEMSENIFDMGKHTHNKTIKDWMRGMADFYHYGKENKWSKVFKHIMLAAVILAERERDRARLLFALIVLQLLCTLPIGEQRTGYAYLGIRR